ncbi:MAG TPA: heme biosynthesis HemY N-terminal domain-containing protein [Candidatus Sulfotelmatobacter sp.]|nr:heme biosynthesis HemY N-terminal domain-containing protein [Candidatus Sulfotelmatobacter sp.]
MLRIVKFLIVAGVLVAVAFWLTEYQGTISVVWLGRRADISTALAVPALGIVIVASALAYRLWRAAVTAPARLARARRARRRERGYHAVTLGLVAAAAGDGREAARQSRRATALLDRQPLTLMLAAQAAQLDGDETAARRHFDAMLAHPDAAFLGLRGLIGAALDGGDAKTALGYAERARALAPHAPWLLDQMFDLHAALGDWPAAAAIAETAARRKTSPPAELARRKALAALGQADDAEAAGALDQAIRHARAAVAATPGAVPAVARLARLHLVAGRPRDAVKLIEQSWPAAAHPELAALYGQAIEEAEPLARVKRFERLLQRAPDEPEGHLALADAALHARLWGAAREHYERAGTDPAARARAYRGLAELEERERHDRERALDWRTRAAAAPPAPFWLCERCDRPAQAWSVRCPHCGKPGTLVWHQPVTGALSAVEPAGALEVIEVETVDEPSSLADRRLAALAQAAGGAAAADAPDR